MVASRVLSGQWCGLWHSQRGELDARQEISGSSPGQLHIDSNKYIIYLQAERGFFYKEEHAENTMYEEVSIPQSGFCLFTHAAVAALRTEVKDENATFLDRPVSPLDHPDGLRIA